MSRQPSEVFVAAYETMDLRRSRILLISLTIWTTVVVNLAIAAFEPQDGNPTVPSLLLSEKSRIWTDSTGKFTVEAKLTELNSDSVTLLKADQLSVNLPLGKLSVADQAYVRALNERLAAVAATPHQTHPEITEESENETIRLKNDMNSKFPIPCRDILLANTVALELVPWTYEPSDNAVTTVYKGDVTITLPPANFPDGDVNLFISGKRGDLMAVFRHKLSVSVSPAHLTLIDRDTAQVIFESPFPYHDATALAVTPDRKRILTKHSAFGYGSKAIVFWDIDNSELVRREVWSFEQDRFTEPFTINSFIVIDDRYFATVGTHLALWDTQTAKALHSVPTPGAWGISRNQQTVVFSDKDNLRFLRVRDGQLLGQIQCAPEFIASIKSFDFSQDGRTLIAAADKQLHAYDLTTGQPEFVCDLAYSPNYVESLEEDFVLLNNHVVIDTKLQTPVWEFQKVSPIKVYRTEATHWIASFDQLAGRQLLNPSRLAAIKQITAALKPEDVVVFSPGSKLAVVTKFEHLGPEERPTSERLRKRMEDNGFVLDDSAPMKLEAIVNRLPTVERTMRHRLNVNSPSYQLTIRYTPHRSELKLILNGDVLWQTFENYSAAGPVLRMQSGETPQQAAERNSLPDPNFFAKNYIPTRITRLPKDRQFGKSKITPTGFQ